MSDVLLAEVTAEPILHRLLASPSVQTDLFEEDPAIRGYLRETVAAVAIELGLQPEYDSMGNLVVRVGPSGPRRSLIFGYAMTHPANRMESAFVPTTIAEEGGRRWVRGRGAAEQKASVTAALMAAGWLQQRRDELDGELVVCVATAGETGRHDAARAFLEAFGLPRFDWALVALGTDNLIGLGNKGRVDLVVTVRGRSAHSSTPWAGIDAIGGAVEVMRRLNAVPLEGSHPQLGSPTLTVTSIHSSPNATHTLQDEVRMTVDRRLLPGDDPARVLADVRGALAGLVPWAVEVEMGPAMHPSEVADDAPLVRSLQAAAAAAGRPVLGTSWSHGAIDAGFFNQEGIPAVMLGPGDPEMFHTSDERVALDDVSFAARLYAITTHRHLTGGSPKGGRQ